MIPMTLPRGMVKGATGAAEFVTPLLPPPPPPPPQYG